MNRPDTSLQWLACEIHDGLMPWLHGAQMQLATLRQAAETDQYKLAMQCLRNAIEEGRALMGFLEGMGRGTPHGLTDGIRQFLQKAEPLAQQAAQQLRLQVDATTDVGISTEVTWSILRILQQAVMNAVQHAGPTSIQVTMQRHSQFILLEITDQGRGFDTHSTPAAGQLGLASMKRRAAAIHGNLEVQSQPGQGTKVSLRVPVDLQLTPD
ncbi:MAG: ATP-binding protein [Pirellulaceae bacterium]|nr:ATP-binding protein [Pirellulaceae bacterium]